MDSIKEQQNESDLDTDEDEEEDQNVGISGSMNDLDEDIKDALRTQGGNSTFTRTKNRANKELMRSATISEKQHEKQERGQWMSEFSEFARQQRKEKLQNSVA